MSHFRRSAGRSTREAKPASRFLGLFSAATMALVLGLLLAPGSNQAATPSSGTVSQANPEVTWTGPFKVPTASANCGGPNNAACDNFLLTVQPPPFPFVVEIKVQPALSGDWDLQVYSPAGQLLRNSGNAPGVLETIILVNPAAGTYTVAAAPFAPAPAMPSYTASARIKPFTAPVPGTESIAYTAYPAPGGLGRQAGEPSVGVNWNTNNAMYIAFFETLRIGFDDCVSPPRDNWQDVSFLTTSLITADPILTTDNLTGRTFVSQLLGATSAVDHQSVGGGRFAAPLNRDPNGTLYPHAVYYCSQDAADALCSRSDDGGLTFGPSVPIYNLVTDGCGGLHGSVKVSPADGTAYVPNKNCGQQAVVASENNGITWQVRRVPGSAGGEFDPSVGIATDGTVYFGFGDADGHPKVAVSRDRGLTWSVPYDVGIPFGIENTAFPAVVAGDPNRAAFAFLGTSTAGFATGSDPNWPGVWHLYVAHTYDGGQTWTTLNVTPNDPVQRGMICSEGINCAGARNLLDFMDADIDKFGRVIVGYADGCVGACVDAPPNTGEDLAAVARQTAGKRMFAQYDALDVPDSPLAKAVTFEDDPQTVHLSWTAPDDHGSPITAYHIYRRTTSTGFTRIATVAGNVLSYDDTITPGQSYFYQVTAENAFGESAACGEITPSQVQNPCAFLGIKSVTAPPEQTCTLDLAWDAVPAQCPLASASYNIYRSTDASFTPSLDNAIALGVGGLTYRDQDNLASGVTYHYIVRAEDASSPGSGPNGGTEDGNLVRMSGVPQGPLGPGPDFSDDVEPNAEPGYETFSTRDLGGWAVNSDPTAHSQRNSWVALDDQPGLPILTQKNDTLTLPPLNLTSSSSMTFWHNFDFARFPASGAATRHHSGGVLEVSGDGSTWKDLGPYITSGGYNGTLSATAQSPIKGQMAWVGSSDGNLVPGRIDPMQEVMVNLGSAVATEFSTTSLPGARVRFRLGGTFQILIGGVQGSGWGVDDITVTGLLAPGECDTVQPPQPDCSIDSVSPGSGQQGQTLSVTIAGSNFKSGAHVVFSQDGNADDGVQEGAAAVSSDGNQVTLQISIDAAAPEGPRDVAVIAPDGTFCVKRSAFVVTGAGGGGGSRFIACNDPSISRKGGWHQIADARSSFGQYCRNVGGKKSNSAAFMELPIQSQSGGTVSVIYARGPRGGNAQATTPSETRRIDFFRPATDPVNPDNSGRVDLTFGFSDTFAVPQGGGSLRIDVLNDAPDPKRDMVYIEGFIFTESQEQAGRAQFNESSAASGGSIPAGGSVTTTQAVPAGTVLLTVVADALQLDDLSVTVRNQAGVVVASSDTTLTPEVAQVLAVAGGTYTITVNNKGTVPAPYEMFIVNTVDLSAAVPLGGSPTGRRPMESDLP